MTYEELDKLVKKQKLKDAKCKPTEADTKKETKHDVDKTDGTKQSAKNNVMQQQKRDINQSRKTNPFPKRYLKPIRSKNSPKHYSRKTPSTVPFVVTTSNIYEVLTVEENPQHPIVQCPTESPSLTKQTKNKRKVQKPRIIRKVTKLESAAKGSIRNKTTECQQHRKVECQYENPHRTSQFEKIRWTKTGFVQTASHTHDELHVNTEVKTTCYSFGKQKHVTKIANRSYNQMFKLLLLCGDVETNPGPRAKKQSAATKSRKEKLLRSQESEDERRMRLDKQKTSIMKHIIEESPDKRQKRLATIAEYNSELRLKETPEKKKRRLATVSEGM